MGQSAGDVIYFVLTEAARFQEQFARGDFRSGLERPFDALHSIPAVKGDGGGLSIGPEAERRIRSFIEQEIAKRGYSRKLEIEPLIRQFKEEIVERFVRKNLEISDVEATIAFELSLAVSVQRLKKLTHLIPCQLVNPSEPCIFTIGPVKFCHFDTRWPSVVDELIARHGSHAERERIVKDVSLYYREFNWIAEVSISDYEMARSRQLALEMTKAAVEGLRLILNGNHPNRLLVGGPASGRSGRSHVVLSAGKIELTEIGLYSSIFHVDDAAWKGIDSDYISGLRHRLGVAIASRFLSPTPAPFATRFIDALHWFGLATEDTSAAAKIVMYLIAVERLLVPVRADDIQSKVQKRAAYFCEWAKHGKRVKKIYDARNHLAHGKCSPTAPEIAPVAELAHEFARQVLLGILRESEAAFGNSNFGPAQLVTALDNAYEEHKRRGKERPRNAVF